MLNALIRTARPDTRRFFALAVKLPLLLKNIDTRVYPGAENLSNPLAAQGRQLVQGVKPRARASSREAKGTRLDSLGRVGQSGRWNLRLTAWPM